MLKASPRIQLVSVDQLRPWDENPRSITVDRFDELKHALRNAPTMLRARPAIALPDGRVIAGNMRQRALASLKDDGDEAIAAEYPGWKIPTFVVELTEDEARAWAIRDNVGYGEWLDQALAEWLFDLEQRGNDLSMTGLPRDEITKLLDSVDGRKGPNNWPDDPAPEPPANPKSTVGRVYQLGPHRIMCGDSTKPEHVAKLLDGAEPRLCVSDPPYGVQLDLDWRADEATRRNKEAGTAQSGGRTGKGRYSKIQNDDRVDWSAVLELVPSVDVIYWWHASTYGPEVGAGLERVGFTIAQQIVWDKVAFVLSRGHYHWRHEAAMYAVRHLDAATEVPWYGTVSDLAWYARRKGSRVPFLGSRDQTTIWAAPSPKRKTAGGEEPVDHPTQKPTLLWTRPITNHTLRGDTIYEPFSGSGTALIAAEMTGRVCAAMELDPAFVDVARERYRAFTEEGTTP